MKGAFLSFLNPLNWIRAWRYDRANAKFDKSSYDLELYLYSKILKNDMLHYGYFEAVDILPETIALQQLEDAQLQYAQNIIALIEDKKEAVLDVGCGMGGLSALLMDEQYIVEALTPNSNQKDHIHSKYPRLVCHHTKFETFSSSKKYGTVIHSESLQYINLQEAFYKTGSLLLEGGRWIVSDYFRTEADTINKSGHLLSEFLSKAKENNWKIVYEKDITLHVLPTISFVHMYAQRFLLPLKHFGYEKLRYKNGWLYYLTGNLRNALDHKVQKELSVVDPEKFISEKKYMLFVLQK